MGWDAVNTLGDEGCSDGIEEDVRAVCDEVFGMDTLPLVPHFSAKLEHFCGMSWVGFQ